MTAPAPIDPARTAVLTIDLQNDFLHRDGAYGRAGLGNATLAALPGKVAPVIEALRARGGTYVSAQFTLVPGPGGAPLIAPHLKELRPFLTNGDFAPGAWGHTLVDALRADYTVEKVGLFRLLPDPARLHPEIPWHRHPDRRRHRDERRRGDRGARRAHAQLPHHPVVGRLWRLQARGASGHADLARLGHAGRNLRQRPCAGGAGMTLRARLSRPEILVAPGIYDGLTAALAADAGFEALYLSGAAVAYTRLGRPDIGLTTMTRDGRHAGADPRPGGPAHRDRRGQRLWQCAQCPAHHARL